eukprot:105662-Rhodomonas_salina.3
MHSWESFLSQHLHTRISSPVPSSPVPNTFAPSRQEARALTHLVGPEVQGGKSAQPRDLLVHVLDLVVARAQRREPRQLLVLVAPQPQVSTRPGKYPSTVSVASYRRASTSYREVPVPVGLWCYVDKAKAHTCRESVLMLFWSSWYQYTLTSALDLRRGTWRPSRQDLLGYELRNGSGSERVHAEERETGRSLTNLERHELVQGLQRRDADELVAARVDHLELRQRLCSQPQRATPVRTRGHAQRRSHARKKGFSEFGFRVDLELSRQLDDLVVGELEVLELLEVLHLGRQPLQRVVADDERRQRLEELQLRRELDQHAGRHPQFE